MCLSHEPRALPAATDDSPSSENFGPERQTLVEIARQGRLTFAGLGESTATLMNHKVSEWAMEDAELAWDRVPVEIFVPVRVGPRKV